MWKKIKNIFNKKEEYPKVVQNIEIEPKPEYAKPKEKMRRNTLSDYNGIKCWNPQERLEDILYKNH